jgi:FAD/FMN-containing dehydrogenase
MTAHATDAILSVLKHAVTGKVLTDPDALQHYGRDWTRKHEPAPLAVVFPKSTEEVQAIVKAANQLQFKLVPSGGRTGLSGGAMAANGEVVVSLESMNRIRDFSGADRTVRCEAGVITQQLQDFAKAEGLYYPVDFAAAGSSHLGGNLSTNAGGIKVIRWGMSREWVAGLTVVTGKGDILELNRGLVKNNTGYDLRHLFIGSEGTLGFITDATMKLARQPKNLAVLVLGLSHFSHIMEVLTTFTSALDLTAFEFFSHQAMEHVLAESDVGAPFAEKAPYYALLEFEALNDETMEATMGLFEKCVEEGWVVDGVVSQSQTQLKNLWRLREGISESIAKHTPYKNDIAVVPSKVPGFLQKIDDIVSREYPDFEIIWFGHIGDGNLHLNILKPAALSKEEFFTRCEQVNTLVFETVAEFNGSISAEHGVGLLKKDYLPYTRSSAEIEYMRAIKRVFDPNNVMNPGKVIDL